MRIQVLNWNDHFESSKSREWKTCSFVCVPNKQHGMGLTQMLSEPDGATIYGIWCLLLGFLSRQKKPRNGYLTDTGQASGRYYTCSEMALVWRRPVAEIERAFEFICRHNISWAQDLDASGDHTAGLVPANCPDGMLNSITLDKNSVDKIKTHTQDADAGETTGVPEHSECIAFGMELGLTGHEVRKFWNQNEALGWKIKGQPIVDWRAAMRQWKEREPEYRGNKRGAGKAAEKRPDDLVAKARAAAAAEKATVVSEDKAQAIIDAELAKKTSKGVGEVGAVRTDPLARISGGLRLKVGGE